METILCQTGEEVDIWSTVEGDRMRVVVEIANGVPVIARLTLVQAERLAYGLVEEISVLRGNAPAPRTRPQRKAPAVPLLAEARA